MIQLTKCNHYGVDIIYKRLSDGLSMVPHNVSSILKEKKKWTQKHAQHVLFVNKRRIIVRSTHCDSYSIDEAEGCFSQWFFQNSQKCKQWWLVQIISQTIAHKLHWKKGLMPFVISLISNSRMHCVNNLLCAKLSNYRYCERSTILEQCMHSVLYFVIESMNTM